MPQNSCMEAARRIIQIVRVALLACIVLYAVIVKILPTAGTPSRLVFKVITLLSLVLAVTVFAFRRIMVQRAQNALALQPEDRAALARWRTGYLVLYLLCEAIATYGVMLHFMGFNLEQVAPFFITGFVLILFYSPRAPVVAQAT